LQNTTKTLKNSIKKVFFNGIFYIVSEIGHAEVTKADTPIQNAPQEYAVSLAPSGHEREFKIEKFIAARNPLRRSVIAQSFNGDSSEMEKHALATYTHQEQPITSLSEPEPQSL